MLLSPWRDVVVSELPDLQLGCASVLAVSASTLFACHNSSRIAPRCRGVSRVFHTFGSGPVPPQAVLLSSLVFQQFDVQASLSRRRSLAVARSESPDCPLHRCERCAADSNIVGAVTAYSSSIERYTFCGMQHDGTRWARSCGSGE